MTTRAATAGLLAALTWIVTALLIPAGVLSERATPASNVLDLVANVLLVIGLAGFAATSAVRGWLGRIGLFTCAIAVLAMPRATAVPRWIGWIGLSVGIAQFIGAAGAGAELQNFAMLLWFAWFLALGGQ